MGLNFNGTSVTAVNYNGTDLTKVYFNNTEVWSSSTPLYEQYLCLTANEANSRVHFYLDVYQTVYTSSDKITWTTYTQPYTSGSYDIYLNNIGDKIYFRGNFQSCGGSIFTIKLYGNISISGNVNTLLSYTENIYDISDKQNCFSSLFSGSTSTIYASDLILPATTLGNKCYDSMFMNCTSLITAPILPATTLASYCYNQMFMGCSSLTTPPALPATTLAIACYNNMFKDCTSLTKLCNINTSYFESWSCANMFYGCSNIFVSTTMHDNYIYEWRLPQTGTATKDSTATSGIISNTGGEEIYPNLNTTYYTTTQPI